MTPRGGRPPKLSREQAAQLVADFAAGRSMTALARELGVVRSTVRRYIRCGSVHHRRLIA